MKTIVCYGDSNTYGYNPVNGLRYPKNVRWTGVLQKMLGEDYVVIEEGCNGRTTVFEDPEDSWKNGLPYLKPCLNTHKPVDIVIMMLGSNDLKNIYHATTEMIAEGAERLIKEIYEFADNKQCIRPEIILVAPPVIGEGICDSAFGRSFDETAITRSKKFAAYYKEVACRNHCLFFDASQYVASSEVDCLHLMPEEHYKMAEALYAFIQNELTNKIMVKTKRLAVIPFTQEELEEVRDNETDPEMKVAYGEMLDCMQENPGREYWGGAWKISLHDGTFVGDMCFKGAPDNQGAVEIGYGIQEDMQGNGYATEMTAGMVHWALTQAEVSMVIAEADVENIASQKILLHAGFQRDGMGKEGLRYVVKY